MVAILPHKRAVAAPPKPKACLSNGLYWVLAGRRAAVLVRTAPCADAR